MGDNNGSISLIVGERGVLMGEEITLNYGCRSNEDWILHYGFLPHRNEDKESIELSSIGRIITWKDIRTNDPILRKECMKYLSERKTTLKEDLDMLQQEGDMDYRRRMAIRYRS